MKYLSTTRSFVLATTLILFSGSTFAAFFQLAENSGAGLGNAFAGGAAIAEDATTVWYNPAGLTRLKGSQFVAAGHLIFPSTEFENRGSTSVFGASLVVPGFDPEGGDAGEAAPIGNVYYSQPVDGDLTFGIGINVPFGLSTEYDDNWVGRYHALLSEIQAVNINPAFGQKINDRVSIGYGVNVQIVDARLTQAVDFGGAIAAGLSQTLDGEADIDASASSLGFNVGVLFNVGGNTRIGVAHRSAMRHSLHGVGKFKTVPAALAGIFVDTGIQAEITFPATTSLSVYHELGSKWSVMGDVTETRWGRLPELRIEFDSGIPDSVVTLDLDDVLRSSIGVTYKHNDRLTYRFGIAYDESPTQDAETRTARLPDEDRTWLTFGVAYKKGDRLSFDVSYAYIEIDDAEINQLATPTNENTLRGNLVGEYDADVNLISFQGNWKFRTR